MEATKGDVDNALKWNKRCLAIEVSKYESFYNCLHMNKNRIGAELEQTQKGLAIQLSVWGEDHPDIAVTHNNIAILEAKGDCEGALEHYKKCFDARRSLLGLDHPDTKSCLESMEPLPGID